MKRGKKLDGLEPNRVEVREVSIPWGNPRWCRHQYQFVFSWRRFPPNKECVNNNYYFCNKCGTRWGIAK